MKGTGKAYFAAILWALYLANSNIACDGASRGASGKPHVLLITVDTLRADHLGLYGYSRETSPTIDALGAEGVVFETAMAQRSITRPSLVSILTSQYPVSHGVRSNLSPLEFDGPFISELLRAAGYSTAAFFGHPKLHKARWPGFEHFDHGSDEEVTSKALEWVEMHHGEEFFVWLHYFAPHDGYEPADQYAKRFTSAYSGSVTGGHRALNQLMLSDPDSFSEGDLAHVVGLYDGEIASVDDQIGLVIEKFRDLGILDNTILIFTADHGEELYQRNQYFFHDASIYDSTLHIPLIFRYPDILRAGERIPFVVQSIDIAPTVLELLGLPIPKRFAGTSLMRMIEGDEEKGRAAYAELGDMVLSVRTDSHRYISNPRLFYPRRSLFERKRPTFGDGGPGSYVISREELYDSKNDTFEMTDIAEQHPELTRSYKELLENWKVEYSWRLRQGDEPDLGGKTREELVEAFRALGYVN